MRTVEIKHTVYPRFPDIMDHDLLAQVTPFDRKEQRFISQPTSDRQRYLRALYLKAMRYLGHSRFLPKNLPRLIRIKIAEATQVTKAFADLMTLSPVEKSRIVTAVRAYLQIKPYAREARKRAEADLQKGVAREESGLSILINETIRWFAEAAMELPKIPIVAGISQKALHAANRALQHELGKILRTSYMLRYGLEMPLRYTVQRHTTRHENWNQFDRNIFHGFGGLLREKDQEAQEEIFWFLTVVQNAIALWNALALEQALTEARQDGIEITNEDLKHALPTMIEHINFVGQFLLDFNRQLPFKKAVAA